MKLPTRVNGETERAAPSKTLGTSLPFSVWKLLCILIIFVLLIVAFQFEFTEFQFNFKFGLWSSQTMTPINVDEIEKSMSGVNSAYRGAPSRGLDPLNPGSAGGAPTPKTHIAPYPGDSNFTTVAIGMGITFRGTAGMRAMQDLNQSPLMRMLLPSFCDTATLGYEYHFYITYDFNDPFLENPQNSDKFRSHMLNALKTKCSTIKSDVHLAKLPHSGKPAWAQNDAMMEAYLDGIQYFYRINDDTVMKTPHWTEEFIKQLASYSPPNIGVTGPMHAGGNTAILTYDFTHISHFKVFGCYYPRLMTDWYADRWITDVYKPGRSTKLTNIQLVHTMSAGTRYAVNPNVGSKVVYKVSEDKSILRRYVKYAESDQTKNVPDGRKIISMSLYGADPKYTYGAIRNAQLAPVIFPGWTLRFYMENPFEQTRFPTVPERIIKRLRSLGAQIKYIDTSTRNVPPMIWRFLVGDDLSVEYFIVRDSDSRLTERDFTVVTAWIKSGRPFHCIRDHPSHAAHFVSGGLWGGRPVQLRQIIRESWEDITTRIRNEYMIDMRFLNGKIWPLVNKHAICHDSVSCTKYVNAYPFPVNRYNGEHIGQVFDAYGEPRQEDLDILQKSKLPVNCTVVHN